MTLEKQHRAALDDLEAAKRACHNPIFEGRITDPETLQAFKAAQEEVRRCRAKCSELARRLANSS